MLNNTNTIIHPRLMQQTHRQFYESIHQNRYSTNPTNKKEKVRERIRDTQSEEHKKETNDKMKTLFSLLSIPSVFLPPRLYQFETRLFPTILTNKLKKNKALDILSNIDFLFYLLACILCTKQGSKDTKELEFSRDTQDSHSFEAQKNHMKSLYIQFL